MSMAELTISPEEICAAIESNVASYTPENQREEVGRVLRPVTASPASRDCTRR